MELHNNDKHLKLGKLYYLNNTSKEETYNTVRYKVSRSIFSCKSADQLHSCEEWIRNLHRMGTIDFVFGQTLLKYIEEAAMTLYNPESRNIPKDYQVKPYYH